MTVFWLRDSLYCNTAPVPAPKFVTVDNFATPINPDSYRDVPRHTRLRSKLVPGWQKPRRTLLAPGQLYGSPAGEYQDCYRMLRQVTLTKLYRRAVRRKGQKVLIYLTLVTIFHIFVSFIKQKESLINIYFIGISNYLYSLILISV